MADRIPIHMGIPWDPWDPGLSHSYAHLEYKVSHLAKKIDIQLL